MPGFGKGPNSSCGAGSAKPELNTAAVEVRQFDSVLGAVAKNWKLALVPSEPKLFWMSLYSAQAVSLPNDRSWSHFSEMSFASWWLYGSMLLTNWKSCELTSSLNSAALGSGANVKPGTRKSGLNEIAAPSTLP